MFVVTVTFEIKTGSMPAFVALVLENAAKSMNTEIGCHRFDVCLSAKKPNTVFLYEHYEDEAAFQDHLASKHFKAFNNAVHDLIEAKSIETYALIED